MLSSLNGQVYRRRLLAGAALLSAGLLFYLLAKSQPPVFHDLHVYYQAGEKALHHRTAYDVEGHYQFKYGPAMALILGFLFSPFALGGDPKTDLISRT